MATPPASAARWTRLAAAFVLVFAVVNAFNAINKGGDAAVYFEGGRRLLHVEPLYDGSSAADGFIGPPFQAVFFAPFAAVNGVSPIAAKLLWHVLNVGCLIAGIALTARTWRLVRADLRLDPKPYLPALFVPVLAVVVPLQTNFEHQNMNALLLALIAGAAYLLVRGSDIGAGALIGAAVALKAFPAILILLLLFRGRWRAMTAAIVAAIVLTLLPLPFYGAGGYADLLRDFSRLANSGFPIRSNNQSLTAALARWNAEASMDGVHQINPYGSYAAIAVVLVSAWLVTFRWRTPAAATMTVQLWTAIALGILLSPIAWDHYWLLIFPALVALYDGGEARLLGRAGRWLFWIPAVLISGLSPLTIGRHGFNVARSWSSYTVAGLIVFAALIVLCARLAARGREAR
jgi:alpha-1,2-mannosyltransferase